MRSTLVATESAVSAHSIVMLGAMGPRDALKGAPEDDKGFGGAGARSANPYPARLLHKSRQVKVPDTYSTHRAPHAFRENERELCSTPIEPTMPTFRFSAIRDAPLHPAGALQACRMQQSKQRGAHRPGARNQ